MERIVLSVRGVVEHILRCGDIGGGTRMDASAMWDGAKAHRKIQRAMGDGYQKEVTLRLKTTVCGYPVLLQGRADGIFTDDEGGLVVDEIKTTTQPIDRFLEQQELHLGQARCYAWMLLQNEGPSANGIAVQLTYYHLETGELQRFLFPYTQEELQAFFQDLMERYGVWLRMEQEWRQLRNGSIKELDFPFPDYRRGQRELAVAAYRAIQRQKKLYVQAPTGIGKTLSTLFPSVKALGEGLAEKIFYLTAKTVTRGVAEDALRLMAARGLRLKSVTLRAKDKICFLEEAVCTPDTCPYARGHYDRVNGAVLELVQDNDLVTPEIVRQCAEKHRVCPHETALDVALWTDAVIGDYNHAFDPRAYLKRFFAEEGGEYIFLIDEAHNLDDRVRDMYTAALRKSEFLRLKRELKDKGRVASAFRGALGKVNAYLLDARKSCGGEKVQVAYEQPGGDGDLPQEAQRDTGVLCALLALFSAAAEEWLAGSGEGHPLHADVLGLYFEALAFTGIYEWYDKRFATLVEVSGSEVVYTLYCMDPSGVLAKMMERAKSAVLFSATLTPLPYYRDILGGKGGDMLLSLPSPFDQKRLLLAAHCGISTRYADREDSAWEVARTIGIATTGRQGNYLVFFPSYRYMQQVFEAFQELHPTVDTVVQQGGMDEEARAAFLARFDAANRETLVGFCVLGGIFSEGIDLKGDRLIGTVIVGVGLPGLSLRRDLIRDYYNRTNGRGYDYAYVYPGMNKVLQAAGRVIRCESDYGVVVLVDSRFGTSQYAALYPAHWSGLHRVRNLEQLAQLRRGFFDTLAEGS